MYKYNIIEQVINSPTYSYLQFRYSGYCFFNSSIIIILKDFLEYQSTIDFKIFEYIVIENNIFIKI